MRHPVFSQREAAFVLECSEAEVRNMQRRGERMQAKGLTDEEVVDRGALPVCETGDRRRGARPLMLARHHRVRDNKLREAALRAIASGRMRAPRAAKPSEAPPAILDRFHLL